MANTEQTKAVCPFIKMSYYMTTENPREAILLTIQTAKDFLKDYDRLEAEKKKQEQAVNTINEQIQLMVEVENNPHLKAMLNNAFNPGRNRCDICAQRDNDQI